MQIPRKVHVTWRSKNILDNQSPVILNGIRNIIDLNPNWQLEISDDDDVEHYLEKHLDSKDYELLRTRHFVEKSDVWRLLKMYFEGGMYIDIDRPCNQILDSVIDSSARVVLPTNNDYDFSQDLMIGCAGDPIYAQAIHINLVYRHQGHRRIYFLGAQAWMHAVTTVLFDGEKFCNTNPGSKIFAEIRQRMSELPWIQTYRENFPDDTLVYRKGAVPWRQGNGKHKLEFYQEFDVQHWVDPN